MRTSGAATEARLTIAIGVVALGVAVLMAGGPAEFMLMCERAMRSLVEAVHQGWLSLNG